MFYRNNTPNGHMNKKKKLRFVKRTFSKHAEQPLKKMYVISPPPRGNDTDPLCARPAYEELPQNSVLRHARLRTWCKLVANVNKSNANAQFFFFFYIAGVSVHLQRAAPYLNTRGRCSIPLAAIWAPSIEATIYL